MNPTLKKSHRTLRLSSAVLLLFAWLVLLLVIGFERQNIADWWALRHYQAPPAVAQLANDDTMTPKARKFFYVNKPQLQPKATFTDCNLGQERAAVLGCYHSDQAGIFVLSVGDARLNGIEQVTAAHEMLHAAYDRLSSKQKDAVDVLLQNYYEHDLHDPVVQAQMAAYKQSEPHDVVNEMHSVFGTEVGSLPPALEQYYEQYFTNRSKIVDYYNQYQGEFTSREAVVKADDSQLVSWKTQIDGLEASLRTQYASLRAMQDQLTADKQRGDIDSYNAGVPGYNRAVDAYQAQSASLQALINQYNQLVATRNSVALETQQLSNEITSQAQPINK